MIKDFKMKKIYFKNVFLNFTDLDETFGVPVIDHNEHR